MGYAMYVEDTLGENLFNLETPANTFDKLRLCGYDWFSLINAVECDGHVSGTGMGKKILLENIKKALRLLDVNKLKTALMEKRELEDPLGTNKAFMDNLKARYNIQNLESHFIDHQIESSRRLIYELEKFMQNCITWCQEYKRNEILIRFE